MFVLRDKTRLDSAFVPPSQRNDQIHDSCVMTYLFNKIQQVEPVLADDEYQHNGVFKIVRKHEEGPPSQPPITISFFFCRCVSLQAVLGKMIFGETHAALWWVGISLTLSGLLVLHESTPQIVSQEDGKKDN